MKGKQANEENSLSSRCASSDAIEIEGPSCLQHLRFVCAWYRIPSWLGLEAVFALTHSAHVYIAHAHEGESLDFRPHNNNQHYQPLHFSHTPHVTMSDDNAPNKKQRSSKTGYRPSREESGEQRMKHRLRLYQWSGFGWQSRLDVCK